MVGKSMTSPTVYIVHCVDTEGPLYESLHATFERLEHIYHIRLEPSKKTLQALQKGDIPLNGLESAVKKMLDPTLLAYNETWNDVDRMLDKATSPEFRNNMVDSQGNGWVYSWFCADFVEYTLNPRRRDMGYHNIYDHYRMYLNVDNAPRDIIQFHYHPHPIKPYAHVCATNWLHTDKLYQTLCRRIIDRNWFPAVNRPGFQVNRPDSNWFLEQYIPFDYSSLAIEPNEDDNAQHDFSAGRSGDWRRAPQDWTPYHPSHDDYQIPGHCRRWITRCLNIGTRSYLITEKEVHQAFQQAKSGMEHNKQTPVILSFADHDFRDIRKDVNSVRNMLQKITPDYPDISFEFTDALTAMRKSLSLKKQAACDLNITLEENIVHIKTKVPTFGPQPYLSIKTVTDQYIHDNLDFQKPNHEWTYTFDDETLPLKAIEKVGVASNNSYGITTVSVLDIEQGKTKTTYWNDEP